MTDMRDAESRITAPAESGQGASERDGVLHRVLAWQLMLVTIGRVIGALLQAVLLVLAARALEVAEFGHLMAFIGVVTLAQVTVDCGVQTYISRERAASPASGGVTTALRFTVFSSIVLMGVLAAGLAAAAVLVSPVYWSMLPLAAWGAGERNADMRLAVAFADGDVHVPTLNLVVRRAAMIVFFVGLVHGGLPSMVSFSIASAVAALGAATFANLYIRRRVTAPASITFKQLLRESRPYWVSNIALQARNLDAVIVSSFAGAGQAGLYSSGSRMVNPLQILPVSLAAILLPASARTASTKHVLKRLLLLTGLVVAGLSLVYAVLFAGAPLLVREVLGARYDGSATVIRLILLGLPFSSAAVMFMAILQGRNRGREVAVNMTVFTVTCLVGIAAVAPFAGAAGAAAVLSGSFVVQVAAMGHSLRRLWRDASD